MNECVPHFGVFPAYPHVCRASAPGGYLVSACVSSVCSRRVPRFPLRVERFCSRWIPGFRCASSVFCSRRFPGLSWVPVSVFCCVSSVFAPGRICCVSSVLLPAENLSAACRAFLLPAENLLRVERFLLPAELLCVERALPADSRGFPSIVCRACAPDRMSAVCRAFCSRQGYSELELALRPLLYGAGRRASPQHCPVDLSRQSRVR